MKPAVVLLGAVVAAVVLIAVVEAREEDTGFGSDDEVVTVLPNELCEQQVEKALKAPASASHPDNTVRGRLTEDEQSYRLESYVDATNSLGAEIRTDYVCEMTRVGTNWRLDDLSFR